MKSDSILGTVQPFPMSAWFGLVFGIALISCSTSHSKQSHWVDIGTQKDAAAQFDSILRAAEKARQPLVVDFRADWCTACVEMEKDVFSKKDVQNALAGFSKIRFDATEETAPVRKIMMRYSVMSLPTLLFIRADGTIATEQRLDGYQEAEAVISAAKQTATVESKPAPAKSVPAKSVPAKSVPAKSEPAKSEPAKR